MEKQTITPDTSIVVGDRVQSHDFPDRLVYSDRPPCYVEGVVVNIIDSMDYKRYAIKVEKRVWNGEEEPIECEIVHAPVNGTPTTFGKETFGVIKVENNC
jgi:hypothetical protein